MKPVSMEWTKEAFGISYLGEFNLEKTRVSIERIGSKAILREWYPGCQFSPKETLCKSFESAKRLGESIMKETSSETIKEKIYEIFSIDNCLYNSTFRFYPHMGYDDMWSY
jgi:hypothetical protein